MTVFTNVNLRNLKKPFQIENALLIVAFRIYNLISKPMENLAGQNKMTIWIFIKFSE